MSRFLPTIILLTILALVVVSPVPVKGQSLAVTTSNMNQSATTSLDADSTLMTGADVVSRFVATETQTREALNYFTFKRDVILQTLGHRGEVTGEYLRNSEFVFDDRGNRIERIIYRPPSTIREMRITREDIQDLGETQLLGVDITQSEKYDLKYTGIDTLHSKEYFVIEVNPAHVPDPHHMKQRYFVGRIWLDPTSFQIVKVMGRVEPSGKQRFPRFETWRELVVDGLNFPIRTWADDVLTFPNQNVHYRIQVRYHDYKRFASKLKITEIDGPGN